MSRTQPFATTPLRIVHLITDLDRGGAETMLQRLLAHRDRARLDTHVICLSPPGPITAAIVEVGVPVHSLGMRPGRPSVGAVMRLVRLLRKIGPDVIQTWLYHADLLGTMAAPLTSAKTLVWNIRCAELDMSDHPATLRAVLRLLAWLSQRPDTVICNSAAGRQAHERLGYRPRRWEILPNGFDTERFRPEQSARRALRERLQIPEECLLVGLLARYHPMKDHASFLQAARLVADTRRDVGFVLAGRDIDKSDVLKGLCDSIGPALKVHLLPEIDDAAAFLAALDVAVSSSYSEAFPNVIGEAMACGTPCVVTDVGESAHLVGETGRVVPPRQPAALATAMLDLLSMEHTQRERQGRSARARIVDQFSLGRVTRRYEELYYRLAGVAQ